MTIMVLFLSFLIIFLLSLHVQDKLSETKPIVEELVKKDAILHDGRTLIDTGIISARGRAWLVLVAPGCSCQPMILELIGSKKEVTQRLGREFEIDSSSPSRRLFIDVTGGTVESRCCVVEIA
ncbi:unnamed protein product [Arabidopsis thaliana]|uniref:Uncharacterized protein n=1 Tax=Arabidopsis thaliana TaxID=3702 RepID=A0A5S9XQA0_ARATH|nr:unnamed protein product [Arabidopsis thaliana]